MSRVEALVSNLMHIFSEFVFLIPITVSTGLRSLLLFFFGIGSNHEYELSAVLMHFGVSAYSGHYVAHIRDKKVCKSFCKSSSTAA